ncbi:MAG TPA: hypothetical protein VMA35_10355 [Candidatus Sulfopaludibacter sp.]|nr:hypothetical protein [Candidatus Sulfopaludibacter sp.]
MNRAARQFVLLGLGLAIGLTGGMALLNFIVDPFNRYGNNRLGVYISAERECKSTYVGRFPHDALLVGNSRETRIPPGQLDGFRFFNGAFSGATPEEIYYFLQHFAWHQRLVVLAVDAGAQDPAERHGDIFAPQGLTSALDNLLNLQTTEYSIRTISESLSKKHQPIEPDGLVPVGSSMLDADRDDPEEEAYRIKFMQHAWDGYHCPPETQMSFFVKISECLRQRAIPCVVVIPPTHEAVARSIQSGPAAKEVAAWKRQLGTIFPHVIDLSFSSYDATTNFYRTDPIHFKPAVGVRLMNADVLPFAIRILNRVSQPTKASNSNRHTNQ